MILMALKCLYMEASTHDGTKSYAVTQVTDKDPGGQTSLNWG